MDMDESAEEHSAAGEQYEEEIVPKIITDEVYEELTQRGNVVIRDLQNSKQYVSAEDVQKLLLLCQNLRQNVNDEKDKLEQMKVEVNNAQARTQQSVKASKQDQEVIQQLKSEIGEDLRNLLNPSQIKISLSPPRSSMEECRCFGTA
jgi:hypothetical protein